MKIKIINNEERKLFEAFQKRMLLLILDEVNKVLTADHAYKIGRYMGWYYNQNHRGRIIIGKETRRSSYIFEYALVAGITASVADAFLLHVTTTPSVAYVVSDLSGYQILRWHACGTGLFQRKYV